ncbi:hypothetical protein MKQ68_13140 [Chitinophaga horti]|uniref:Uncharacterized protein n=1 Tax=Chitinophaga horti TaxID=2920382 RepID=A0ABY6IUJ1_9BACT|nr:hypothetical protein [Chitinophaga horti]UYQ91039.1 hypothetical protein MKQ68_13140 [Chitinophaga horti]
MKYTLLMAATVACYACGSPAATSSSTDSLSSTAIDTAGHSTAPAKLSKEDTITLGNVLYDITEITQQEFDAVKTWKADTSEARVLRAAQGSVNRVGDTLFFHAAQKRVMLINKNNPDNEGDDFCQYNFMGELPGSGQWLLFGGFYESYAYVLISKETGDTTFTIGEPVVSPDGKYLVAGNADLEAAFTTNGFELYTNGKVPVRIDERLLDNWGPSAVKWQDARTLVVEKQERGEELPKYIRLSARP